MISRVFAEVAGSLGRCWRSLALADLACKLIAFVLLAPLVTVLLRLFMAGSGATWLTDEEILFFVVSPLGIVTIATAATAVIAIVFVELSALMTICISASGRGCAGWRPALRFTASRWKGIAGLAFALHLTASSPIGLWNWVSWWGPVCRWSGSLIRTR